MRYIQTPVFKFEELSEDAQQAATTYLMEEHFWGGDALDSLRAFCKHFGVTLTGWNYGPFDCAEVETDATASNFRGLSLKQARALPEYPTGYCLDCSLREYFIKEFERTGDAFAAFNHAMDEGIKEMRDDWEEQFKPEYVQEHCVANGYEFEEDGTLI